MTAISTRTAMLTPLALAAAVVAQPSDWEFVPTPFTGDSTQIRGSDAVANDEVWAAGGFYEILPGGAGELRTLVLRYNGVEWTQTPTPTPNDDASLFDVLAVPEVAPGEVFAVGTYRLGGSKQGLFLRFDGSSWTVADSPTFIGGAAFEGLGRAGDDVWLVGSRATDVLFPPEATVQPLAMRWTGGAWQEVDAQPLAGGGRGYNFLVAVDGASENDAWAVGRAQQYIRGEEFGPTLYMNRFNGTEWELYDPGLTDVYGQLSDVLALATDNVWAVGSHDIGGVDTEPLIMHWDGTAWTIVDLPRFPAFYTELRGITARSATEIYAAGTIGTDMGRPQPFVLKYDGTSWTQVSVAPTDGFDEWFRTMTITPGGDVWALGSYFPDSDRTSRMLAQRLPAAGACRADLDGDGSLTIFDFLAFQNLFDAGDPIADFDGDGDLTIFDFLAFQNAFDAGCE